MSDWIGIGVILLVVGLGFFGFSQLAKPYDVSVEEFEKRAHENRGLMATGLLGLQKFLNPATEKAVEVQEDLAQGRYDGEQESGDPPEAGDSNEQEVNNGEIDA